MKLNQGHLAKVKVTSKKNGVSILWAITCNAWRTSEVAYDDRLITLNWPRSMSFCNALGSSVDLQSKIHTTPTWWTSRSTIRTFWTRHSLNNTAAVTAISFRRQ